MGTGSKVILFLLLAVSQSIGSVLGDVLVYSEGMVRNSSPYSLYNLTFIIKGQRGVEKQFVSILLPGNSVLAPRESFVASYHYLNPAANRYMTASQEIDVKERPVSAGRTEYTIDTSASYWYNDDTYILIVKTREAMDVKVLSTVSQPVEQEDTFSDEKEGGKDSVRVKKIHIVSDMICIGQTVKHSTNRAIFFLRPRSHQPFYVVFIQVGKGATAEVITLNIEKTKKI